MTASASSAPWPRLAKRPAGPDSESGVIETPPPNLVAGMKWLLGTYTGRHNRRHKEFGHLFSGRYKALPVDGSGDGYLKTACDYVHLNPARAKLITAEQPLWAFNWSSFPLYLDPARRPGWLRVDRLLGEWGIPKDSAAGREVFEQQMERRRLEGSDPEYQLLEQGWYLGGEQFIEIRGGVGTAFLLSAGSGAQ